MIPGTKPADGLHELELRGRFDADAELSADDLQSMVEMLVNMLPRHSRLELTEKAILSIREEAAIYDNNRDQYRVEPGCTIHKGERELFRIVRLEYRDGDAVTGWSLRPAEVNEYAHRVADALNYVEGRPADADA